jgi:hypothetical protein
LPGGSRGLGDVYKRQLETNLRAIGIIQISRTISCFTRALIQLVQIKDTA